MFTTKLPIFFGFCIITLNLQGYYYVRKKNNFPKSLSIPIHDISFQDLHKAIIENTLDIYSGGTWFSPLMQALHNNNREQALFLLYYGANPRCKYQGVTPLQWAINHQDYELIFHLLKNNAPFGTREIYYAQTYPDKKIPELLSYVLNFRSTGRKTLSKLDKQGLSPIHHAASQANQSWFDALILIGVPLYLEDATGKTALHYAKNTQFAQYLIKHYNYGACS